MATINGTTGNDTLSGTSTNDTINGLGGNDTILGTTGSDFIDGGAGFDSIEYKNAANGLIVDFAAGTISGGAAGSMSFTGIERIVAGNFNDQMTGNGASQTLTGQGGNDTIAGAGGADTLWGGAGADSFVFREMGTANADRISDFASNSDNIQLDGAIFTALGSAGRFSAGDARFWSSTSGTAHDADDRILFNTSTGQLWYDADGNGSGAAQLIATLNTGATVIASDLWVLGGSGGGGSGTINGTAGNDSLVGGSGNDTINGFDGQDTIDGGAGADSMIGGDDPDFYIVDNVGDVIVELENGGLDTVNASVDYTLADWVNNLTLTGTTAIFGTGNELDNVIIGNGIANLLQGGAGNDTIDGGAGSDSIHLTTEVGGFNQNPGIDAIDGGVGSDVVLFLFGDASTTDAATVDLVTGTYSIAGPRGAASGTLTSIENAIGGFFGDRITGSEVANLLRGNAGNDTLRGLGGNDRLDGDQDVDEIDGGAGNDSLSGGGGLDSFLFTVAPGTVNADQIVDFLSVDDQIVLDGAVHASSGASGTFTTGDARFWSSSAGTAHDGDDRVIYNTSNGQLWYDADGNGTGAAQLIATLQGAAALLAADITIINGSGGGGGGGGGIINGTSGNDSLLGTAGNDTINGLGGADTIEGAAGDDSLLGGAGFDTFLLRPGYGNDTIDGGSEQDQVWFDASAQSGIIADLTAGTLSGGGAAGAGTVHMLSIETVGGTRLADFMTAAGMLVNVNLNGGGGSDTLVGGEGADVIDGDHDATATGGNDWIEGRGGNDVIFSDAGDDTVFGGAGNDQLYLMDMTGENDFGHDSIDGGEGRDSVTFSGFTAGPMIVDLGAGTLQALGPVVIGSATLSSIENFYGSADSNDRITGSSAANELLGAGGNDTIDGAGGNDTLNGGEGADAFLFRQAPGTGSADLIDGFSSGIDRLVLDPSVHANLGAGGQFSAGDARFHAAAGATSGHDATDRVIYNTSTRQLFYDADGSGSASAQLIATLQNNSPLVASDIFVGTDAPAEPNPYNVRILQHTGSSANRVDLAFMGDGYTAAQITSDYVPDLQALVAYMFNDSLLTQPFGRYQSFFNIHAIDVISNESGADHPGGVMRDTALDAAYNGRSVSIDWNSANVVLSNALLDTGLGAEMRLVAINDPEYGGSATSTFGIYSAANASAHELALHEGGHQFATLADQYIEIFQPYPGSEPRNPDATLDPTGAKWSEWLGYDQPGIGVIGAYEGAYYASDIYRPSINSKMNSLGQPFDAVGRQAFVLEFYDLVDPLDDHLANVATLEDVDELWVDTIDPDVILVDWIINGTTYANAGERISLSALGYGDGDYTVTARAYDPTDWVRVADRSSLEESVQWHVVVDDAGGGGGSTINGTSGNDSLLGTAGNDTLNGFDGLDTLDGGAGADSMVGGNDPDLYFVDNIGDVIVELENGGMDEVRSTVNYGLADWVNNLTLIGAAFVGIGNELDNVLTGNALANDLEGGFGRDTMIGGDGNDTLRGRSGGDGDDVFLGGNGNDSLSSADSFDTFDGGAGNDTISSDGNDLYVFSVAPGAANADLITFFASGLGTIQVDGNAHANSGASGRFGAADARFWSSSTGTAHDADDRVIYNTSNGQLWYDADGNGGGAAQLIATLQGAPSFIASDITIVNGSGGGGGGTTVNGTAGNDTLSGTAGNDTINALGGNDTILGSTGSDVIDGGAGFDSIEYKNAANGLVVDFTAATVGTINGGAAGTMSFTGIERIVAGSFNDQLTGTAGSQTLTGQGGNDTIRGGSGNDTLWGGAGNDVFLFNGMGTANADRISDWTSGQDKVHLTAEAFAAIGAAGNFAAGDGRFWAAAGATSGHDANDRVVYNTSTGSLYYDADGSGSGAAQLIATMQNAPAVAATDIAVI